ncbi:amino acid ABC transporter permease [Clostridium sp. MSTE9]|uniref:amino acid ABC transporter permease n=1 Tax=Clostridium sp. (strain MSTE9) TaxID=1105031 RepID=UPI000684F736|nr:amino acid ABC transporter permease [Clostridium sp. MSTE9]
MNSSPFSLDKWGRLFVSWQTFAEGFLTTLVIAVLALALALLLGIVFGMFSSSHLRGLRGVSRVYVEFIQNIPLVIQIFFLYNGLPLVGIMLDKFTIGVLGIGVYTGAYISEVVRAGIQSIPVGQMEAAKSQGFTHVQAMRYIVLPQTVKIVLPPLTNQAVNLIKNTSVLAMIAGGDLMYRADSWASSQLLYGPAYVTTGLLYFVLCFPLATWARNYEQRLKSHDIQSAVLPQKSKKVFWSSLPELSKKGAA